MPEGCVLPLGHLDVVASKGCADDRCQRRGIDGVEASLDVVHTELPAANGRATAAAAASASSSARASAGT